MPATRRPIHGGPTDGTLSVRVVSVPGVTLQSFGLANPLTYRSGRLTTIGSELGQAMHRANVDRRHGELTSREARLVRREDDAVRSKAVKRGRR
jgi:hypothetical protein